MSVSRLVIPKELNALITFYTKDGRILMKEQLGYEGGLANPMSWDRTVEKFHWLSEAFADQDLRSRLIRAVQQHGADFGIGPLQECGNPRRGEPHNRSARRWGLLGEPSLHEQGEPGHDLLVEFGGAANSGIVFADYGGILVRVEIEGI